MASAGVGTTRKRLAPYTSCPDFGGLPYEASGNGIMLTTTREIKPTTTHVFCSMDLGTLLDGLECQVRGIKEKLGSAHLDEPVFYDMTQKAPGRLYPSRAEYPDTLDNLLNRISQQVSPRQLANAVEKIEASRLKKEMGKSAHYTDLAKDSDQWNEVKTQCGDHLEVLRVQRVVNDVLQDQYDGFVRRMAKKPGFSGVNEQRLFNGTARTDPAHVCLGTEGFDPRMARDGNYGRGIYFSTTPNYSAKHYSYDSGKRLPAGDLFAFSSSSSDTTSKKEDQESHGDGGGGSGCGDGSVQKQFLLARVACGNVCDMGNHINQTLTRPPPMDPMNPFALFDSVRGGPFTSRSSEMSMVVIYDKAQACPDFLITFAYKPSFEAANRPKVSANVARKWRSDYQQWRKKCQLRGFLLGKMAPFFGRKQAGISGAARSNTLGPNGPGRMTPPPHALMLHDLNHSMNDDEEPLLADIGGNKRARSESGSSLPFPLASPTSQGLFSSEEALEVLKQPTVLPQEFFSQTMQPRKRVKGLSAKSQSYESFFF